MKPDAVLDFWLGERGEDPPTPERTTLWFGSDPDFDERIRERFGDGVEAALAGGLSSWTHEPSSRVALIILLDQFTRNLYRGDSRSFAGDVRALSLVRETTAADRATLHPLEHYFVLVPYMHAEDASTQREGETAFGRAVREVPEAFRALFENGLDYASRHRVVIERFGRFPHRNAVLGRRSTEEEERFLAENPTGF